MLCDNNPRMGLGCLTKPEDTIAQLICFNTHVKVAAPRKKDEPVQFRHANEMLVAQFTTLRLYQVIRSREMVSTLFQLGIELSYW